MRLISFFSAFLFSVITFAGEITFTKDIHRNINQELKYYEDEADLSSIAAREKLPAFKKITTNNVVLDFKETKTWINLNVRNPNASTEKMYLAFSPAYIGSIELYSNNDQPENLVGSLYKAPQEQIFFSQVLPVSLTPGQNNKLIKIKSVGAGISVIAYSEKQFNERKKLYEVVFFLLIGAIGTLGLYQLFFFFTTRKLVYLYYWLYSFALIGCQYTLTGYFHFLPKDLLFGFPIGYLGSLLFSNLGLFAMNSFAFEMLELKEKGKYAKVYSHCFNAVKAVSLFAAVYIVVTESAYAIPVTRILGLISVLLLLGTSVIELRNKNYNAKLFLLSWSPFLAGIGVTVMVLNGVLSSNYLTDWALGFAAVVESLVLAFALGKKLEHANKTIINEQNLKLVAYEQIEENFEKLKHRDAIIKSYVSPTILTEVALRKDPLSYEPRILKKCIMFCDIRDYTTLTEKTRSEEAATLLNVFFEAMNDAVFTNFGEVDKLIGDAVMATFDRPLDCLNAVTAFRQKFKDINEARVSEGLNPIYVGIGITYGDVLAANFGSRHKLDRTIVGDVVNVASRFDGLSKAYKVDIICSESFINELGDFVEFRPLDIVRVKGKTEELVIYEIFHHVSDRVREYKIQSKAVFEKMIESQKSGDFETGKKLLQSLLDQNPDHTYRKGQVLDLSLPVIIKSLDSKIELKERNNGSEKNKAA